MRLLIMFVVVVATRIAAAEPHVVIVSIDGLRADAVTKDAMPRAVRFAAQGARAKTASTISMSLTLPSHASMISGRDVAAHGMSWNSYNAKKGPIKVATIFTSAHDHKLTTAMIVGKDKLRHLVTPGAVDHFEIPRDATCNGVAEAAAKYFTQSQPSLMFVHFSNPDDAGHASGWSSDAYRRAVIASDRCLGVLIDAIDGSPAARSTFVIVTADHGGQGRSHADGSADIIRHIPWFARGPGIESGSTIDHVDTFDTAATALAALGLPRLPEMLGVARVSTTP
jgi:arylsulfatase A-like enzyme